MAPKTGMAGNDLTGLLDEAERLSEKHKHKPKPVVGTNRGLTLSALDRVLDREMKRAREQMKREIYTTSPLLRRTASTSGTTAFPVWESNGYTVRNAPTGTFGPTVVSSGDTVTWEWYPKDPR